MNSVNEIRIVDNEIRKRIKNKFIDLKPNTDFKRLDPIKGNKFTYEKNSQPVILI